MSFGHPLGAHLMQNHRHAGLSDLPGGLRTCEAGTDDVDGI